MDGKIAKELIILANRLRINCNKLKQNLIKNNKQIEFAYNPLDYAWKPHEYYLRKYGSLGAKTIIMGMNPGHGMGNTGIPFGCPKKVKNYLKIVNLNVKKPRKEHPKREIMGLECKKPEISGKRIWNLIEEIYGPPSVAFKNIFVLNHFPLWMFNASGQNITPDKLNLSESKKIFDICNKHLADVINTLHADTIIGVGKYAHKMAKLAIMETKLPHVKVKEIPHPSPANPIANKNKGKFWKNISKEIIES